MADNTDVSNAALAHIGSKRVADFDDESEPNPQTVYCRLYLAKTRDALLRSHWWRFAKARAALSKVGTPAFQFDNKYSLPPDFLRAISIYTGSTLPDGRTLSSYELEGTMLLTNANEVNLRYIRRVEDPDEWDPLFAETFELAFARKLAFPLSQDLKLKQDIDKDLAILERKVRAMDRTEGKHIGRDDLRTWNDARWSNIP
jgi:hypothetical protein